VKRVTNLVAVAAAVVIRPGLWLPAIRLTARLVPDRWWTRPLPSRSYLSYRGNAVYGLPLSLIPPADVVTYLEWCKSFPGPIR